MAVTTYKCPNCDGGLLFDPQSQQFHCEYCASYFSQQEMEKIAAGESESSPAARTGQAKASPQVGRPEEGDIHTVVYSCPSCGAEIATDETTASSFCYYCHNPVILSGRLEGSFRPDKVIPFAIDRDRAVQGLLDWTKKKKFIPRDFFSGDQIEKVSGVYFPYWMVNSQIHGKLSANATKVRTWQVGDVQYTETSHYRVGREGDLQFRDLGKNALKKENGRLVDGVQPFDSSVMKDFSSAYLSGFQAEKRDVEKSEYEGSVDQEIKGYSETMLRNSVTGYTTVSGSNMSIDKADHNWSYALLPVWVLTYKGHDGKIYFYAMNGQTGKVSGILPVDKKRLFTVFGLISLALFILLSIGGYLL